MRKARVSLQNKIDIKRGYKLGLGGKMGKQHEVSRQYIHVVKNDPNIVVPEETSKPKWQRFFLFWRRLWS